MSGTNVTVFLSSRINEEMRDLRARLKKSMARSGKTLITGDQAAGARPDTPVADSLGRVEQGDLFVIVIGREIGEITVQEWREADRLDRPELVYFTADNDDAAIGRIIAQVFPDGRRRESIWHRLDDDAVTALLDIAADIDREVGRLSGTGKASKSHLAEEIVTYCRALRWQPTEIIADRPGCAHFEIEKDGTQLVICIDDKIGAEDIDAAAKAAQAKGAKGFRLISEREFPGFLYERATAVNGSVQMVNDFLLDVLDIEDDINQVEATSDEVDLSNSFIEIGCNERCVDSNHTEVGYQKHDAVRDYARTWLKAKGRGQLAVLGDFGTGKSWFCLSLCQQLGAQVRQRIPVRLPLLIRLGKVPVADGQLQLRTHIAQRLGIESASDIFLTQLLRSGRLLLVLDGFDELGSDLDNTAKRAHLLSISELTRDSDRVKLLLTSRRAFFDSVAAEGRVLNEDHQRRSALTFEIVYLAAFRPDQVDERVRRRFGSEADKYVARIQDTPNLPALVRRPIVLDLVLDILATETDTTELTLYDIYTHCSERWLRKAARDDSPLDTGQRAALMSELAWRMYVDNKNEITRQELPDILDDLLLDLDEFLDRDVMPTARMETFLVRNGDGRYAFAHRSFMEFFAARKLIAEFEAGRPDLFGVKHISDGVADFLVARGFDAERLAAWLNVAREGGGDWLAGNVLTLLNAMHVDLSGMDLSGLVIQKANLANAKLRRASFRGSTLDGVVVGGADLGEADCREAKLDGLNLGVKSSAKTVACAPNAATVVATTGTNRIVRFTIGADPRPVEIGGHDDSITCVRFGDDGKTIASVGFDNKLRLWNADGTARLSLSTDSGPPYATAILDDYHAVLVAGRDTMIYAWDTRDGRELRAHKHHRKEVYCIATFAKGRRFATASFDGTVGVWTLAAPELGFQVDNVQTLKGHKTLVNGVDFSPDGEQLVSCDNHGIVIVYRQTGGRYQRSKKFAAHTKQAWCVRISPDGRLAATCSSDGTIALWSTADWSEQARLRGHESAVWNVAFDATAKWLVSCSLDSTVRLWDLARREQIACVRSGDPIDPGLRCDKMNFEGATGLSPVQKFVLRGLGAKG